MVRYRGPEKTALGIQFSLNECSASFSPLILRATFVSAEKDIKHFGQALSGSNESSEVMFF